MRNDGLPPRISMKTYERNSMNERTCVEARREYGKVSQFW